MGFRAQTVNYASQFNRDVTRTDNRNAFWQSRQLEEAVGIRCVCRERKCGG
jgi:hypothetical protein